MTSRISKGWQKKIRAGIERKGGAADLIDRQAVPCRDLGPPTRRWKGKMEELIGD